MAVTPFLWLLVLLVLSLLPCIQRRRLSLSPTGMLIQLLLPFVLCKETLQLCERGVGGAGGEELPLRMGDVEMPDDGVNDIDLRRGVAKDSEGLTSLNNSLNVLADRT